MEIFEILEKTGYKESDGIGRKKMDKAEMLRYPSGSSEVENLPWTEDMPWPERDVEDDELVKKYAVIRFPKYPKLGE